MRPLFLLIVLVVLSGGLMPASAQTPLPVADTEPPSVLSIEALAREDPTAALRLVAGLGDTEARRLLLEEIERQRSAVASEAGPSGLAVAMVRLRDAFEAQAMLLGERLTLVAAGIVALPGEVVRIVASAGGEGRAPGLLWVGFVLLAALGAGWLAQHGVGRTLQPFRATIESAGGAPLERLGRASLRLLLDGAQWLAFAAVGFALNAALLAHNPTGRALVAGYVTAALFVLAAASLCRFVLAPYVPRLRLLALGDDLARFLDRWIVYIVAVGSVVWLTTAFVLLTGRPPLSVKLAILLASGLVVLVTLLTAIWRAHRRFTAAATAAASTTLSTVFRRHWASLVTAYMLVVAVLWAFGMLTTGRTVLWPAVASLLVVGLLPVIDRAARRLVAGFVEGLLVDRYAPAGISMGGEDGGDGAMATLADTTEASRRYTAILHRVSRFLIGALALIALLQIWGIDPLARLGAPGADRVWAAMFDIAVTIGLAFVVWQLVEAALTRQAPRAISTTAADWEGGEGDALVPVPTDEGGVDARARTLLPLIRKFILAVLAVMVVMITLSSLGVDIGPLLAGAGVVGLAIGFGAQSLVRDVVSGVFFLIDDAFRIGEYIEMDEIRGEVEAITPRSLRLRHHRGAVHTIPFGELRYITNYNRDWTIYKMKMRVAGDTDPQLVKKIIKEIGKEMLADPELGPKFIEPLKSQGIFEIDDDGALVIRVKFMSKPREQFVLRREAFHRIQKAFAAHDVAFAKRNVEVNVLSASSPIEAAAGAALAEPTSGSPTML